MKFLLRASSICTLVLSLCLCAGAALAQPAPGDAAVPAPPASTQAPAETPGPDPTTAMFRYVDASGSVHFVKGIDRVPREFRDKAQIIENKKLNTYSTTSAPAQAVPTSSPDTPPAVGGQWNAIQIGWVPYEKAFELAREKGKPLMLVIYTNWSPDSQKAQKFFEDPKIVEIARSFVMVKVNSDSYEEVDTRYAPDGRYIPRILFFAPDGSLYEDINMGNNAKYFWGTERSEQLLWGMQTAQWKYRWKQ